MRTLFTVTVFQDWRVGNHWLHHSINFPFELPHWIDISNISYSGKEFHNWAPLGLKLGFRKLVLGLHGQISLPLEFRRS